MTNSAVSSKAFLIFDMDGTLTDTMRLIPYLIARIWKMPLNPRRFFMLQGFLSRLYYVDRSWFRPHVFFGLQRLGGNLISTFWRFFRFGVIYVLWLYVYPPRLFNDTISTLIELRKRGYLLGIATNGSTTELRRKVPQLLPLVDYIATKTEVNHKKPNPEMIQLLLKKSHHDKKAVYLIGDTKIDEETAQNSDIPFILVTKGTFNRHCINTLNQVRSLDNLLSKFP